MRQFKDCVAPQPRPGKPIPQSEAGLTLIEMMIVLVIIAIVSGLIVMSGILDRPDQARVTAAKTNMTTLAGALAMYRLDNGDYPTADQGLKALAVQPSPPPPAWHAYVQEEPKDPWGRDYVYAVEGGAFTITSLGKDGKPGGEGVDADLVQKGQ
ncbi:type II secretion system major pseudopilin GspG [Sphingomonas sp. LB-2]|uniref:type II secretion system major pseudopilin GspG n=1 Tax=Sphingomonas caeni TaxID=2984949 RepID=UPI00222F89BA|nr:type II secretion system major pseudopilin GspG [Sphingomonas caeni]MCW3847449.1 type II secretion system major pseudopilin GspG [Sphingomonas caeni]